MPLTLATFRGRYKEFDSVPDPVVQTAISDALERTPTAVWGDGARQEKAQAALAAHELEMSPYGRDARIEPDERTVYMAVRERMETEVAPGHMPRVA